MNLNKEIQGSKTLQDLLEILNSFERDENDEHDRLEHHIDLCDLPTFGKEPEDTTEIFSWDGTHYLIQNTCTGPAFEIVSRKGEFK